jgi:histidine triad (HIT) family protein
MQSNCIFCKIIAGEIPSATIYEDEDYKVIMDIGPAAKGHAILLTKNHCDDLFSLDDNSAVKGLLVARKVARAIQEVFQCDGMNMVQNNGAAAGQTVDHFHLHLIPRYHGDQVKITWNPGKYADGEAVALAAEIAGKLE